MISLSPIKKKEWHCKKKNVKEKTQHLVLFQCASGVQYKTGKKSIRHLHIVASCFLNID